jgi:hypothetical protein
LIPNVPFAVRSACSRRLTEQAKENAGEEMASGVPLSVMVAHVARRRPILLVAKAGLGLRRGLYAGLLCLILQVLWRQIGSIVRGMSEALCKRFPLGVVFSFCFASSAR